jgi:hypothetical protein
MENPYIRRAADMVDAHLKHAVFTVWMMFYCVADDFGFVDVGDDVKAIARLCMLPEQDLLSILCVFQRIGLIEEVYPEAPQMKYLLYDWDVPKNAEQYITVKTSEKLRKRRERVAAIIANKSYDPPTWKEQIPMGDPRYNAAYRATAERAAKKKNPPSADDNGDSDDFGKKIYPQNDKNLKNVTETDQTDKTSDRPESDSRQTLDRQDSDNRQNLDQTESDKTETDRHAETEKSQAPGGFSDEKPRSPALLGDTADSAPDARTDTTATGTQQADKKAKNRAQSAEAEKTKKRLVKKGQEYPPDEGAAPFKQRSQQEMKRFADAFMLVSDFFSERNLTYADEECEKIALRDLSFKIIDTPSNLSPQILAMTFCRAWEKLRNINSYFEKYPMTASAMMTKSALAHVLTLVNENLVQSEADEKRYKILENERVQIEAERVANGGKTALQIAYEQSGISPDEPGAALKFIRMAKK